MKSSVKYLDNSNRDTQLLYAKMQRIVLNKSDGYSVESLDAMNVEEFYIHYNMVDNKIQEEIKKLNSQKNAGKQSRSTDR